MVKVKDLTIDELEYLIEQKVLEVLGGPDSALELKDEFQEELRERLKSSAGTGLRVPVRIAKLIICDF